MFFSFAINTGVLITAKISVQAAADAAAYAGAATQARQLNAISYLNYDMRRQYKKFLYRYLFVGNIGAPNFPTRPEGLTGGEYGYPKLDYISGSTTPVPNPLKVPVICIPLTAGGTPSDNCLMLNIPNTASLVNDFFPNGGLTQITNTLLTSITAIQQQQNNQCKSQGSINLFVLMSWLFRGTYNQADLVSMLNGLTGGAGLSAKDVSDVIAKVEGIVSGLGLYPRNIINLMRIETLSGFLNQAAEKSPITQDQVTAMQSAGAEAHERTIQAFKSALVNLNANVMDPSKVTLTELQNDNQITLQNVQANFNSYVQFMDPNSVATSNKITCASSVLSFPTVGVPVGVKRTDSVPTHYAVKISATAKLLFLPISDGIELQAFASAQPFGSRIGPANMQESDFVESVSPGLVNSVPINDCSAAPMKCNIPNLNIDAANKFNTQAFLQSLGSLENIGAGGKFNMDGRDQVSAEAPNPSEVGHYNILPPAKDDMSFEFIPYAASKATHIYRFYAPIFPESGGDPHGELDTFMTQVFGKTSVGNNAFGINMPTLKADVESKIWGYVQSDLTKGGALTEYGETTTFAAIELPMSPAIPYAPPVGGMFWLTKPEQVLSSWGPDNLTISAGNKGFQPRFGYSVKFVAMQKLIQSGMNSADDDEANVQH